MPAVATRDVGRRFGAEEALSGVTLQVDEGEIVALVGNNGAGKSTLLRILATIVSPSCGTAAVAGHDVEVAPGAVRRSIGTMLGDERSLYWRLTGRHNLEFAATVWGLGRARRRQRVNELISAFGLEHAADELVATYSTGMRSRLMLARALISAPRVLLLDEPTRSLDAEGASFLRATLRTIAREQGTAVLLATHAQEDRELAGRVLRLEAGRLDA